MSKEILAHHILLAQLERAVHSHVAAITVNSNCYPKLNSFQILTWIDILNSSLDGKIINIIDSFFFFGENSSWGIDIFCLNMHKICFWNQLSTTGYCNFLPYSCADLLYSDLNASVYNPQLKQLLLLNLILFRTHPHPLSELSVDLFNL